MGRTASGLAVERSRKSKLVSRERVCAVASCKSRHYAKGWCKKHYAQVLRHGKLTPEKERGAIRICLAGGCGRTDTINWYCRKHARQMRVHGRLTPEREHLMGIEGCRVKGCKEPYRARGFCAKHYNKNRWQAMKAEKRKRRGRTSRRR
jgi:hypothetical protein